MDPRLAQFGHPQIDGAPTPGPEGGQPAGGEKLLAGKYKTVEELERGYLNMQTIENQNREAIQRLSSEMEQLREADRMDPGERANARRDPLAELQEVGVPADAVAMLARQAAQEIVNPIFENARAHQTVAQAYPDFASKENEVAQFIEQQPELRRRYQSMFQADRVGAMEWAYMQYERSNGGHTATGAEQANARMDAILPRTGGGGRQVDNQEQERLKSAYDYGLKTNDWDPYTRLRLNSVIPASHYEGLQGR